MKTEKEIVNETFDSWAYGSNSDMEICKNIIIERLEKYQLDGQGFYFL